MFTFYTGLYVISLKYPGDKKGWNERILKLAIKIIFRVY